MWIVVLFALVAGFCNILSGVGSFLFTSNSRIQDIFYLIQILVGIGFIYIANNPAKTLKRSKSQTDGEGN